MGTILLKLGMAMGSLTFSCGHVAKNGDRGTLIVCKDIDCDADGCSPALVYSTWCRECVAERTPDPEWSVFASDADAEMWLGIAHV